jgi:hypothetical protein
MGSFLLEVDRFESPQGRFAPAGAGRRRRSWRRPGAPVVRGGRSGRRNGPAGRTEGLAKPSRRRSVGQGGVRPRDVVVIDQRDERGGALA